MSLRIFNTKHAQKLPLLFVLISSGFPISVHSASCGLIPSTYPLYTDDKIKIKKDISINGTKIDKGEYTSDTAIDTDGSSNDVNQNLPGLDPSSFPSNTSEDELKISSTKFLDSTSQSTYKKIEIEKSDINVTFSGGDPFHIKELKIKEENVILNFASGIYYIDKFEIEAKDVIINTSPSVIFHIGDEFKIKGDSTKINTSGNVDHFLVYLHSGAEFESEKKELDFTGLIYGTDVDKVKIKGKDSSIHGTIIVSGGEIEIEGKDISFVYTSDDQTTIGNLSTCENNSGGAGGGDTTTNNFNCVEPTTADVTKKQVYTKLAGTSFALDIVALKNGAIDTNYNKTVSINIIDQISSNSIDSQTHTFNKAQDSGRKQLTFQIDEAYRDLICRVSYTAGNSANSIVEDSDNFSVRPVKFTLSSTDLTNTNAPSSSLAAKVKAGNNFILTATAISGYDGTPKTTNINIEAHSGGNTGALLGGFNPANSAGIAEGTSFTYSEVGFFRFLTNFVYDDAFTAVDQGDDCTDDFNTPVSGKIGCKFGNTTISDYFGRFTPDHFDVTLNTPVFTPSCSSFTYLGQPIKYAVNPIATVLAKNASGATTQNYTGNYWKIDPLHGTFGFTPTYTESSNALTVLESSAPVQTDNGDGTGLLTFANTTDDILAVTKNTLTTPFDAEIALNFDLTDTDAIAVANVDGVAQLNPVTFGAASTGNGISFSANNKNHRWGRVNLDNVHGSELTPLSVPLYTEYYNGSSFIKNTADNCTTFTFANDFSISDASDFDCSFTTQSTPVAIGSGSVKATLINSSVNNGETELTLSDNIVVTNGSGAGNTGHVDITTRFTNLPWLLYDWDGNSTHDNCPSARATFGIYKGNEKQIYFREVY